jgi:hypothetical protein
MDLFNDFDNLPDDVKIIINDFNQSDNDYINCQELVDKLNKVGYTCEFGLDSIPFNLTKI